MRLHQLWMQKQMAPSRTSGGACCINNHSIQMFRLNQEYIHWRTWKTSAKCNKYAHTTQHEGLCQKLTSSFVLTNTCLIPKSLLFNPSSLRAQLSSSMSAITSTRRRLKVWAWIWTTKFWMRRITASRDWSRCWASRMRLEKDINNESITTTMRCWHNQSWHKMCYKRRCQARSRKMSISWGFSGKSWNVCKIKWKMWLNLAFWHPYSCWIKCRISTSSTNVHCAIQERGCRSSWARCAWSCKTWAFLMNSIAWTPSSISHRYYQHITTVSQW